MTKSVASVGNLKTSQHVVYTDSIYAIYQYRSTTGFSASTITLQSNHTFRIETGTDVQQEFSSGTWKSIGDSIELTSFLKKDNLPMAVKEIRDNSSDSLTIDWVKNLNADVIKDAVAIFGNDSSSRCMPVFDECKFSKGSIKRIRFEFGNETSTRWYTIRNTSAEQIQAVLKVKFALGSYIFLDQKKYLHVSDRLYELNQVKENVNRKHNQRYIVDRSFFYSKLK